MNFPDLQITPGPIGPALVELAKRRQEKEQFAAKNLLENKRLDFDTERAKAMDRRADTAEQRENRMEQESNRRFRSQGVGAVLPLLNDPNGPRIGEAQQQAALYGLPMTQVPGAPLHDPGPAPMAPQQPSFVGPLQTPQAAADSHATMPPPQQQMAPGELGPPAPGHADVATSPAAQEVQRIQGERSLFEQQLAAHPQAMREHSELLDDFKRRKAEQQQYPSFQLQMGQGEQPFNVDTAAMHERSQTSMQARSDRIRSLYADDPTALGIAVPMAMLGQDEGNIVKAVNAQKAARAGFDEKNALAQNYKIPVDEQIRLREMEARARVMSAQTGAAGKQDAASARAQTLLERANQNADKEVDWKGLVGMDNNMRGLMANINSPNVLQSRDAQIQLGRIFRGTTPTEGEMHLLYNNLGGSADKWNQFVAGMENGGLSPEQKRQLSASANTARGELEERKKRAFQYMGQRFGPQSEFSELGPQVDNLMAAKGKAIGVDVPPIYGGNAGPGAKVLGSRTAPREKTNLLVRAARMSKLAPADKQAVQWANSNPNDPRSKVILDAHGL